MSKEFDFDAIQDVVIDTANAIFGYKHTKEKARDNLMAVITLACLHYQCKPQLKHDIDTYACYRGFL